MEFLFHFCYNMSAVILKLLPFVKSHEADCDLDFMLNTRLWIDLVLYFYSSDDKILL